MQRARKTVTKSHARIECGQLDLALQPGTRTGTHAKSTRGTTFGARRHGNRGSSMVGSIGRLRSLEGTGWKLTSGGVPDRALANELRVDSEPTHGQRHAQ